MEEEFVVAIVAIASIFIVFPALVFHYVTLWRKQKTLQPDDERMLEDLWRSAKAMERRIETMEALISESEEEDARNSRRPLRPERFED
ncbi:MAG: envelope stress response membrane protein PspB [Pseudomonadota bacterium]